MNARSSFWRRGSWVTPCELLVAYGHVIPLAGKQHGGAVVLCILGDPAAKLQTTWRRGQPGKGECQCAEFRAARIARLDDEGARIVIRNDTRDRSDVFR